MHRQQVETMLVLEAKLKGKQSQYNSIDEAIRTALFIRNKALRHWIDNKNIGKNDLQKLCAVLAKEFDFADKLNSMARQASADRAWSAIARFYDNCKKQKPGKKGFPRFKKRGHSVEYKTSGWVRFVLSKWILSKDERQFQKVDYKTTGIDNLIIM